MKHGTTPGRSLLILLLLTAINAASLTAQSGTSSAISGTVQDATGAMIARATVVATEVNTRAERTGWTNADGRFTFSQVNPGMYTLRVSAPEFAGQTSRPVPVQVGGTVTLNFTLRPSLTLQTVEVTADQSLLSLENPNTTTLEAKTIASLPNPGQDLTFIAQFSSGALMITAGSSNDAKAAGGYGNVEFNG